MWLVAKRGFIATFVPSLLGLSTLAVWVGQKFRGPDLWSAFGPFGPLKDAIHIIYYIAALHHQESNT